MITALAIGVIILGLLNLTGMVVRGHKRQIELANDFERNAALWFILATLLLKGG